MRFTSKDLMKVMGLSVGDRVKYSYISLVTGKERKLIAEIVNDGGMVHLKNNDNTVFYLTELVDTEIEILPRPKRVGDLRCGSFDGCDYGCPLCWICCHYDSKMRKDHNDDTTLYEVLQNFSFDDDQEIHDLLKARLDKEVKE